MAAIKIEGAKGTYLFSVMEATDYDDLPEWGGVYLAVNATSMGVHMEDVVALGSCTSFKKYADKIKAFTEGQCSHLYLLPEFEVTRRKFTMEDLMSTPAFKDAMLKTLELSTLNISKQEDMRLEMDLD